MDASESQERDQPAEAPAGESRAPQPTPESGKTPAPEDAGEAKRRGRRPLVMLIGIVIVGLLIAGGVYYWVTTRGLESTDDAFIDGRAVDIAPRVAGEVISLDVTDNQFVRKGQPLIHIDPRQYQIDRDQAQGALDAAKKQYEAQVFGADIAKKNFPALLQQAQAQLANCPRLRTRPTPTADRIVPTGFM